MKNELSRDLSNAANKIQYDTQCKKVLSEKIILAWILKRVAKEFAQLNLDEIQDCIEGTPEISSISVYPGRTNTEKIAGMPNEDKIEGEGAIYYDIRFFAYAPKSNEKIRMIINIEAQKSFYPGYEIVTRGIFYGARMISAQLGREFSESEYDGMKKVYSIWICMNAPKYIGNAISEYCIRKNDVLKSLPDKPQAYDKLSVVVVALNEKVETDDTFSKMMNTLLSTKKSYEEKNKELEHEFHISMTGTLGKEMDLMCNLSDIIEEKGMEEGKRRVAENLLKQGKLSDRDIAVVAEISIDQIEDIKRGLSISNF